MGDYNFEELTNDARRIDDGIKKLEKIWEAPQNILYHRGENAEESKKMFAEFIKPIKEIRDELMEDMGPRAAYIEDMDRFLKECATACDQLKQDVDSIETLFSEYGYVRPANDNRDSNPIGVDENIDRNLNDSILIPEQMEHLTLSSPISDQLNGTSPISSSVFNNINDNPPKYIATPVIRSVASVMQAELSNNNNIDTPVNEYPREPIYSPYYYKKM